MDNKRKALLFLILLIFSLVLPVSATNATKMGFSDLGLSGPQQVEVYQEGILVGVYNTSESNVTIPDKDFMLVIKPELKNHWFDPGNFIDDLFGYIQTYWEALILFAILIGIVLVVKK